MADLPSSLGIEAVECVAEGGRSLTVRVTGRWRRRRPELRGQAISFFFAISQLAGGVAAPYIFGRLIGDGKNPGPLTIGYLIGAGVMFAGGLIAWFFGVNAEGQSLENIAAPISVVKRPEVSPA